MSNNAGSAPRVLYTIPADGTISAPAQTYVDIVFDQEIDSATVTGPGSNSFAISSGSKAGWILIVNGGGTSTSYWNPAMNQTSVGPVLCASANNGSHSFEIKTVGALQFGKVLTYQGVATGTTCLFDPGTATYTAGPGTGGAVNTGAITIPILTGANAGNYLLLDSGSAGSYIYNSTGDSFGAGPNFSATTGPAANWFRLDSGPQTGNPFILMGAGSSVAKIFVESTSGVATPTPPGNAITNGSVSFRVNSGLYANQYIIAHGGGTTSNAFDQNSTMSAGPVFPNSLGAGAQAFTLTTGPRSGQTVILTGGTTGFAYYNHSLNSFTNLNSLTANVGTDSSVTKITAGTDTGKFFLVNGFASRNTSMLDPAQDNFVGTRLFRTSGGALTAFVLKTGSYAGRTMIVTSGTTPSLYDPSTGTVSPGPLMPGGIAAGTSTMLMTGPINTGKHYIFQGGSSAIYMYDPVAHAFANATQGVDFFVAPTLKGSGSRIFTVPTGPQANNYVILNGGASNQADFFNTTTNTFTTGIAVNGCASINAGSQVFSISTGTHTGKYMIICGGSTTTSVFDPATASFASTGVSIVASPVSGAHGFYIAGGSNAGKYLLVIGAGTTTRMYDPTTDSWGPGPAALCAASGAGGFNIPITAGNNSGQTLIVLGGNSTGTCIFDPQTNLISTGPTTGPHAGFAVNAGSLVIPAGSGLYPTAYVVVYGNASNVFGHWFAY